MDLITDYPVVAVAIEGLPANVHAHQCPDGEIVFWDGKRQYHTGAKLDDAWKLKCAMSHHFGGPLRWITGTGWVE